MFMSKKNKNNPKEERLVAVSGHSEEYTIIYHDLMKVGLLNVVYLVLILTLYYTNLRSNFLENWFSRILHF